jgi:hypothetical protein
VQLLLVLPLNHLGTTLHRKDHLDVDLSVCHRFVIIHRIARGWANQQAGGAASLETLSFRKFFNASN